MVSRSTLYLLVGFAGVGIGACKFEGPTSSMPDDAVSSDAPTDMREIDSPDCPAIPDEDADGIGDACDSCPFIAQAPTPDTDNDGLPDACDPHAMTPDTRVAFEGFSTATLPMGWETTGPGSYEISNGDLVITSGDTRDIFRIDAGSPRHTMELEYSITAVAGNPSAVRTIAALADVVATSDRFYLCGMRFDAQERELWRFTSSGSDRLGVMATALPVPGRYGVRMTVETSGADCYAARNAADIAHFPTTTNPAGDAGVGIRTRNVTVQIHWVAVYTH